MPAPVDRRTFLSTLAAIAVLPAAVRASPIDPLLSRAIRRLGGQYRLSRIRSLQWTGSAMVHAGGRDVAISMETQVLPFGRASSRSWLTAQGPAHSRTLIVDADGGWLERDGNRTPLPAQMTAHERAQYALYGLMLLAPLTAPSASIRRLPDENGLAVIEAIRAPAPPTRLCFEPNGRLAEARNRIVKPEGEGELDQRFIFSREVMPGPVRWPRRLLIEQDGAAFFELTLASFHAS